MLPACCGTQLALTDVRRMGVLALALPLATRVSLTNSFVPWVSVFSSLVLGLGQDAFSLV